MLMSTILSSRIFPHQRCLSQKTKTHTSSTRLSATNPIQTPDLPLSIDSHLETAAAQ